MIIKKGDLVLVEWSDSSQPVSAWQHIDELPEPAIIACESVGWIVSKSKDILTLAPNMGDSLSESNAQCCGVIKIPMSCVKRIVEIIPQNGE